MKEYGGCLYFELLMETENKDYFQEYTDNRIDVDSGRSAIQWILEEGNFDRIWLPVYNCPLVEKRIVENCNVEICWYNLDEKFLPKLNCGSIRERDVLLWVNYCGVMSDDTIDSVMKLKNETGIEIIIDNIPAYFSKPRMNAINIYSCRKFLGVPDGGHIIGSNITQKKLPTYSTAENYGYLLKAAESGSNSAYENYLESERRFADSKTAWGMPIITSKILRHLNYEEIIRIRKKNFAVLNEMLGGKNRLDVSLDCYTPSVYPYLTSNKQLRQQLLENKIYVSRFWKHILSDEKANDFEKDLAEYLIPLPIDQRYVTEDMVNLAKIVRKLEG